MLQLLFVFIHGASIASATAAQCASPSVDDELSFLQNAMIVKQHVHETVDTKPSGPDANGDYCCCTKHPGGDLAGKGFTKVQCDEEGQKLKEQGGLPYPDTPFTAYKNWRDGSDELGNTDGLCCKKKTHECVDRFSRMQIKKPTFKVEKDASFCKVTSTNPVSRVPQKKVPPEFKRAAPEAPVPQQVAEKTAAAAAEKAVAEKAAAAKTATKVVAQKSSRANVAKIAADYAAEQGWVGQSAPQKTVADGEAENVAQAAAEKTAAAAENAADAEASQAAFPVTQGINNQVKPVQEEAEAQAERQHEIGNAEALTTDANVDARAAIDRLLKNGDITPQEASHMDGEILRHEEERAAPPPERQQQQRQGLAWPARRAGTLPAWVHRERDLKTLYNQVRRFGDAGGACSRRVKGNKPCWTVSNDNIMVHLPKNRGCDQYYYRARSGHIMMCSWSLTGHQCGHSKGSQCPPESAGGVVGGKGDETAKADGLHNFDDYVEQWGKTFD